MRLFRQIAEVAPSPSRGALTGVRAASGEALCSTACRHLSNEDLRKLIAAQTPP